MEILSAIVVFSLVWWISLFALLPVGVRIPDEQAEKGFAASAPDNPHIGKKMLWATAVATIVTGVVMCIILYSGISLESILGVTSWEDYMQEQGYGK